MAFRGGRGRGRFGRGGRPSILPLVRDEDGQLIVAKKLDGPPPLFPKLDRLPDHPEITSKDELLVSRRRHLEAFWNASPYYIERTKEKAVGVAAEIERYSDRYKPNYQAERPPLSSVLKLTPLFFPAELLSQEKKHVRNAQQGVRSQWTLQANAAKNDLGRLDQLATLEQKFKTMADKTGHEEEAKGNGEDGEDDDDAVEEEEQELGEDDYAQNFGFDDDEEYEFDEDGDDEGPVY
ncbi:hypothetical protein O6H91_16G037800 [Diphasiastrum complanatum]|uniref:Uncharacterized protein n=1 Tax=Diphasiastrum complanatum TaxID=34168 RepID=A0ACC2BBI8_DIPCM|nr:hypothetical protein O6H91_16G037800 [Diphasiastrum complanatum]